MYCILSFFIAAFGQPVYLPACGVLASLIGYAVFWKKYRGRFLPAFFWFSAVEAVQLFWMTSIHYQGPYILVVYFLIVMGMGIQFALLTYWIPKRLHLVPILAIAGVWTIFEWVRLFVFTGFTWNPVGLAMACNHYSLQWASLFGVYGLSFWVIFVNLLALASYRKGWVVGALLPFLWGVGQEGYFSKPDPPKLSTLLVQTALLPEERELPGTPPYRQWERILRMVKQEKDIDLIVFPESALPFGAFSKIYTDIGFHKIWEKIFHQPVEVASRISNATWAQALADHLNADLIIGLDDSDTEHNYNAAFYFSPKGLSPCRYIKRVLVPMGEYIPFSWCQKLAGKFGITGSFMAGQEATIFPTKVPTGISICIEETYSEVMRKTRKNGAKLFVNLTNDVWFPGSLLSQQHFDHSRIRAVENGVPIIRATNTGVTGVIDAFGKAIAILPQQKAGLLSVRVPIVTYPTLYTFWGDEVILTLSLIFVLALLAYNRIMSCLYKVKLGASKDTKK